LKTIIAIRKLFTFAQGELITIDHHLLSSKAQYRSPNANNPQIEPISFIPDNPSSRQGKSLDYEWISIFDVVVFKIPHRPFKRRTRLEGYQKRDKLNRIGAKVVRYR
jgi:hypothetical protein